MAIIKFNDIKFEDNGTEVIANFLKLYSFNIKKEDLLKIGEFKIKNFSIRFDKIDQSKAEKDFQRILSKGFNELKNKIRNNKTIYIHQNSGIPLIGCLSFGIIDKGTDSLEIKPLTSCNLDCIFCSVDEGLSTKKCLDIVVEKDYIIQETKKLLEFKKHPVNIYINPHGEPLLYSEIIELVNDLKKLAYVKSINIITNGILLNESLAKALIDAGLTSFSISISALDEDKARKLSGIKGYDINKIISIIKKIKDKIKIIITPVFMDGINNKDIEDIILFCKENKLEVMIQNFLQNRRGRKPAKEIPFDKFYPFLKELESKYNVKLIANEKIGKTEELAKPFRKNEIIEAIPICKARHKDEFYAVAKTRVITVKGIFPENKKLKVKITKDRYNIFYGERI
jgi:uncharacterized protein